MSVVSYINGCGLPLLKDFARQLHNHSAMQSLRVLLLPGIGMAREDSSMVGYGFDDMHEVGRGEGARAEGRGPRGEGIT